MIIFHSLDRFSRYPNETLFDARLSGSVSGKFVATEFGSRLAQEASNGVQAWYYPDGGASSDDLLLDFFKILLDTSIKTRVG
jgi:hypothetical protein